MRLPPLVAAALVLGLQCADSAERPRAVVELFTSQGCSSCPPADQLLADLARDPSLIVLSMPVDYWDYIGWKDTLASPQCTARQRGYAAARGDGRVYTPQAVVDGVAHAVGSERAELEHELTSARGVKGALSVDVDAKIANGKTTVEIAAGPAQRATVWLVEYAPKASVPVGRGENAGRTLTYTNVMRKMTRLGEWNGAATRFESTATPSPGNGMVVLVQAGSTDRPGAILGAARAM